MSVEYRELEIQLSHVSAETGFIILFTILYSTTTYLARADAEVPIQTLL